MSRTAIEPISAGAAAKGCAHCGLPLPEKPVEGAATTALFCCRGCALAYAILSESGLGKGYYALRNRLGESGRRVTPASDAAAFSYFDDPTFEQRHTDAAANGARCAEFYLEGVHCAACVWLVEKLALRQAGVLEARLDLSRNRLRLEYAPERKPLAALAGTLARIGYIPHPAQGLEEEAAARRERRTLLIRIGVAGACGGNIMLFSSALYAGEYEGISAEFARLFSWTSLALSLPVVFYSARPFFRSALGGLRSRVLHMDVPIALGIAIAFVSSAWNVVRGTGHIWFDTLAMLVFLLLVGRLLLETGKRRAAAASRALFALVPNTAFKLSALGADPKRVPVEAVALGDLLFIPPGDTVPVDGRIEEGRSHINEALLTGESNPVARGVGQPVFAGTTVIDGALTIRAEQTGAGTRLAKLSRLVEQAATRRAPIVQAADRLAGYFVLGVVALAAASFAFWYPSDPGRALANAIAVLVVSCPCALGMATPFALSVAMGRGARRGILLKGGEAIERLARAKRFLLDKTGTLTEGKPRVVEAIALAEGHERALPLLAAAELRSSHPVAQALASYAPALAAPVEQFHQQAGRGIRALVGNRKLLAGNAAWLAEKGVSIDDRICKRVREREAALAASAVFVALDGKPQAALLVADRIRSDAERALSELRALGIAPQIVSGDAEEAVAAAARALAIGEWRAGLSPESKEALVRDQNARGLAAMVGDGLNDAAALAAAGVGIAVHGGSETAFEAADVATGREGLAPVAEAVRLARHAMRTVHLNLGISLLYNAAVGGLAAFGLITPLWAAVLMPVSSFTVLALSFRS